MFRSRTALKMNRRGKKNEWEIKGLHTVMLRTVKAIRTEREMNVQPFCMIRLIFRVTNKTNKAARWHIESEMVKAFVSFDQGVCALTRQRGDSELFWYFNDEAVPFDPRNISQNGGAPPRCIPAFSGIYIRDKHCDHENSNIAVSRAFRNTRSPKFFSIFLRYTRDDATRELTVEKLSKEHDAAACIVSTRALVISVERKRGISYRWMSFSYSLVTLIKI